MRKVNPFLLSSVFLLSGDYPGPSLCFAGLYALVPCVLKSRVTNNPAGFEPGTAATTTTRFPRFCDGSAFGTYGTDGRRRSCWCVYAVIHWLNTERSKTLFSHGLLHFMSLGLTFAGLRALRPPVIYVFVYSPSAVLVPSATRSATTDSAGFQKHTALWTHHPANKDR